MLISATLMAGAALADGEGGGSGDSEQLDLEGSIPAVCALGSPPSGNLGALAQNAVITLGDFAFTCNLAASGPVQVTATSQHGALKRDDGTETVAYEISWQIQSNTFFTGAGSLAPFVLQSGAYGTQQSGAYKVKVTGSIAGRPAGTYRDTVTYTISP